MTGSWLHVSRACSQCLQVPGSGPSSVAGPVCAGFLLGGSSVCSPCYELPQTPRPSSLIHPHPGRGSGDVAGSVCVLTLKKKITALSKYNSRAVKPALFKCTPERFYCVYGAVQPSPLARIIFTPRGRLVVVRTAPPTPQPGPLTYFRFLCGFFCLFRAFYVNGILQM